MVLRNFGGRPEHDPRGLHNPQCADDGICKAYSLSHDFGVTWERARYFRDIRRPRCGNFDIILDHLGVGLDVGLVVELAVGSEAAGLPVGLAMGLLVGLAVGLAVGSEVAGLAVGSEVAGLDVGRAVDLCHS